MSFVKIFLLSIWILSGQFFGVLATEPFVGGQIASVVISPQENCFAVKSSDGHTVKFFDKNGDELSTFKSEHSVFNYYPVKVLFNQTGRFALMQHQSACDEMCTIFNTVTVFDTRTGESTSPLSSDDLLNADFFDMISRYQEKSKTQEESIKTVQYVLTHKELEKRGNRVIDFLHYGDDEPTSLDQPRQLSKDDRFVERGNSYTFDNPSPLKSLFFEIDEGKSKFKVLVNFKHYLSTQGIDPKALSLEEIKGIKEQIKNN